MAQAKSKSSVKVKVQKFGTALSGMIMPNIGAIIAWGLTAAFFMYPHGWFPNKEINNLVQPMLHYLLPLLIGYTGGRMVYEERGAIAGAIGTLGVIVGTDQPMFLGAMIMGPLSAWLLKKLDQVFQDKIKSGFEMIYNNFSLGILGMIAAIFAFFIIGPIMEVGSQWASAGVNAIIRVHLLPLANIIIEPAKVLFLNNAIGNGILVPLGIQQAAQVGKSVLFLMESNPGPGLGILLAFTLFGKGKSKSSAPGAAIIEFFGGVHEIYFPYVLMKPSLILAAIGGGLKAAASPGSILAILLVSAKDAYFGNIVGVLGAAVVSFIIAAIILKNDKSTGDELEAKQAQMQAMKAQSKGQSMPEAEDAHESVKSYANVKKIIFACDAGMGSSAMGASLLRDKFKKAGIKVSVTNTAVRNLKDEDGLLIITQEELADRALQKTPHAMHVAVGNFLSSPKYDTIVASFKALTQVEDKPKAEKPVKKVGSLEGIDFSKVKEVDFIRHDQHLGTATMATSLFNDAIKKAGKTTPVKAVRINELTDDPSHLVIVTPAANKNLAVRYSDIQTLVVDDLLKDKKLGEAIQKLN
ncbi:PTS mannitol transporter subunit IICBA [Lactobacillus crispatus]|uniref:PTS mannitol transporter subunit IICBA n=1 Tax=Lactobacillus crispatus TaxID=47770 RepID=UPI00105EBC8D|nr:PTS mannitol transporter subunit IICBA [Lactobacillus crispatus]MBH9539927.1 PTS mannitol transporter subunit IICBA [Lactobacillus crispatus]MCZ3560109.1 PTS mannitol transporter subunit IICBA [Lactobacillus crispatus]MCZ3562158.1 PTS mannitol transporter subunit IICBA [Lactobacillus crispatus]MCZ3564265.1 PTS mannitol transporter subunit IICBA [Lactobacillus crispatus]MCZ3566364.1 PTS mannitol transporter subunit IICBA [Lactobacillus crispatus]